MSREEQQILQRIRMFEVKEKQEKERRRRMEERRSKKNEARPEWISKMQDELPECIEFRPSNEEFSDPMRYIESIAHLAAPYGACKIIPPDSFKPACSPSKFEITTKLDYRVYSLEEYRKIGAKRFREIFGDNEYPDERTLEREFWHTVSSAPNFTVQYANDVEGTACGKGFGQWNLNDLASKSLLRLMDQNVPGVNAPMLYIGILFAHFCWHYEDNALYSINYMHEGSPKVWYVVPGENANGLEGAVRNAFRNHPHHNHPLIKDAEKMLMRKTVMCSPSILMAAGVPVYRCTQRPREFIVTFPRGYHAGFNTGFHVGEAVNFAISNWIPYGFLSLQRYRTSGSMSCLDMERLVCNASDLLIQTVQGRREGGYWNEETVHMLLKILTLLLAWQERLCLWADRAGLSVQKMDVAVRQDGDGDWFDRQLCGACNHICHLCYVQSPNNTNETYRTCPEHAKYLGPGTKVLCLRYSSDELRSKMANLQFVLQMLSEANKGGNVKAAISRGGIEFQMCEDAIIGGNEAEDTREAADAHDLSRQHVVVRGFEGYTLEVAPVESSAPHAEDPTLVPTSPFYFVDRFPPLSALLQRRLPQPLAAFRRHLLQQKPHLASSVPQLARLERQSTQARSTSRPRKAAQGSYERSSWRCVQIVADDETQILKIRLKRERSEGNENGNTSDSSCMRSNPGNGSCCELADHELAQGTQRETNVDEWDAHMVKQEDMVKQEPFDA